MIYPLFYTARLIISGVNTEERWSLAGLRMLSWTMTSIRYTCLNYSFHEIITHAIHIHQPVLLYGDAMSCRLQSQLESYEGAQRRHLDEMLHEFTVQPIHSVVVSAASWATGLDSVSWRRSFGSELMDGRWPGWLNGISTVYVSAKGFHWSPDPLPVTIWPPSSCAWDRGCGTWCNRGPAPLQTTRHRARPHMKMHRWLHLHCWPTHTLVSLDLCAKGQVRINYCHSISRSNI